MCDDLFNDCSCDDGCCGDSSDCCDCCCSNSTNTASTSGDVNPSVDQDDSSCIYYLCCAGCLLCPLFYVGYKQQPATHGESIPDEARSHAFGQPKTNDTTLETIATFAAKTEFETAMSTASTSVKDNDTNRLHSMESGAVTSSSQMQRA